LNLSKPGVGNLRP